jgi:hypothetical protein
MDAEHVDRRTIARRIAAYFGAGGPERRLPPLVRVVNALLAGVSAVLLVSHHVVLAIVVFGLGQSLLTVGTWLRRRSTR